MKDVIIVEQLRESLGLDAEDDSFDSEILTHANSIIAILTQVGVCQNNIINATTKWSEVMRTDVADEINSNFTMAIQYVLVRVKILFDPPSATTKESMNAMADELIWRLKVAYN